MDAQSHMTWAAYRGVSRELHSTRNARLTYANGSVEITEAVLAREAPKSVLASLVREAAAELDLEVFESASATVDREDLRLGFEPDASFYFRDVARMMDVAGLDLGSTPPPDLVVDVTLGDDALDKLPLFAAVGVREVWRCDGTRVSILRLEGSRYVPAPSLWLPPLTGDAATDLLRKRSREPRIRAWRESVRDWFERARQSSPLQ